MRYELKFTNAAQEKLAAFKLSAELLYYIDCHLHDELAESPTLAARTNRQHS